MCPVNTDRLRLRRFSPDDVPEHHRVVYGDADVMRYLPGGLPRSVERAREIVAGFEEHWEAHGFGAWAVTDRISGRLMGQCGLQFLPGGDDVEIFYALGTAFWGQGFTTEAARAALRFGFEEVGLSEICALAVPENTASRRVMVKLGMEFQGVVSTYYDAELAYYLISREAFTYGDSLYEVSLER